MSIKSHKLKFSLGRIGRTLEFDKWEYADQQDVNIWAKAQEILTPYQYVHDGVSVTVEVNWSKVADYFKKHQLANRIFQSALAENQNNLETLTPNLDSNLELTASIKVEGKNEFSNYKWYPDFFLENIYMMCFLS